jgi:taurine dioxygenase
MERYSRYIALCRAGLEDSSNNRSTPQHRRFEMTAATAIKTEQALDIRPMTGALGCEIYGVDLNQLSDETFRQIYQAWLDYSVIVFHDQALSQEQFAAFGQRFGKPEVEPFLPHKADVPGVYFLKGAGNEILSTQNLGWHTDHTYQKNPSLGAMLYALDVPEVGGDTLFASNYLAYESLSPAMRDFLEDKIAIHDVMQYGLNSGHLSISKPEYLASLAKLRERFPQTEHPLVCTHPETGRKMLYLNRAWVTAIKGLNPIESTAILSALNEHALQEKFKCRFHWRNGSLLLWDNRCVQHSPTSDYSRGRLMLRLALHSDWQPA